MRHILLLTASAAALMAPGALHAASVSSDIRISDGALHAAPRDDKGVLAFKGIPFAAPPVGDLRWHAPKPAIAWAGVHDASRYGHRCLTALKNDPEQGPPRDEDCLVLNVWTGAQASTEKRPVMVWVHGGGFQFGSGSTPQIEGSQLAAKGAVIVTFNYRLGVLGYLAHPDLDREGPSGDYGLEDQLAALRWVKANIAQFGGDPANVTLFGESAGAHAIGMLMASPLAKGLFQKAIGESGAFWDGKNGPLESYEEAHARGVAFAKRVGATSIAALRAMPADALNAAAPWDFTMDPMVTTFSPNVDHYVVPEVPAARFARGVQMHVPLLAGWNATEQYPFLRMGVPSGSAVELRAAATQMFGAEHLPEFLKLYPAGTDAEAKQSGAELTGDIIIGEQSWYWLEMQQRAGRVPVYGYKFSYTSPYTPIASHITEVPFVFGTLTPQFIINSRTPPAAADRALSNTMMSYWVNFAAHGDPNGPGLPRWPLYSKDGTIQHLGTTIEPGTNPQLARFQFLARYRTHGVFPASWREAP